MSMGVFESRGVILGAKIPGGTDRHNILLRRFPLNMTDGGSQALAGASKPHLRVSMPGVPQYQSATGFISSMKIGRINLRAVSTRARQ